MFNRPIVSRRCVPYRGTAISMLTRAKARRSIASAAKLPHPKRKFSDEWLIARDLETYGAIDIEVMKRLTSNSRRKVIVPSRADLDRAELAFKSVQP